MDVFKTLLLDTPDSLNAITGTLQIANGGTGATSAAGARDNLLPDYTGNVGKVLTVNAGATDVEWTTDGAGTVTSVDVSGGTTGLTTSGGPVTSSGTITLAGTLAVANGGTGITSLGSGVATFLGTPSSANLAAAVTDETGTGALVFANSPTLVTPALGTPASGVVTNLTGTASININGTVGATTPSTVAATTGTFSGSVKVSGPITNAAANSVLFAHNGTDAQVWALGPNISTQGQLVIVPAQSDASGAAVAATFNASGGNGAWGATTPSTGAFTTLSANTTNDVYGLKVNAADSRLRILGHLSGFGGALIDAVNTAESAHVPLLITANNLTIRDEATDVATFSSTGLAVTGALSATGLYTSSVGNNLPFITANGAGTGWSAMRIDNNGGTTYIGTESSVGGTLVGGSTAYDALIRTHTGLSISTNSGSGTQLRVSSTGLAVTGALSSTTGANFATSSGNVGIGTASPSGKLEISLTTGGAGQIITGIDNTTGVYSQWRVNGTATKGFIGTANQIVSGTSINDFAIDAASPASGKLHLSSTGQTVLTITGDSDSSGADVGYTGITMAWSGAERWNIGPAGTGTNNLVFRGAGSNLMTLTTGGDLGIGTASPGAKLDVDGAMRASGTATGFPTLLQLRAFVNASNSSGANLAWTQADGTVGLNMFTDANGGTSRILSQGPLTLHSGATGITAANEVVSITSTGLAVTGTLSCTGALSKGSGSFRIDHPLPSKSATHQLVHSFIEGPKADLIYRGKIALVGGKASVNIDAAATMTEGTFDVLCRDVQCFTTNESGWTAVRGNVVGNILTLEAQDSSSTDTVSWMVIGERKDPHIMETDWTDENGRVIVEPLKPEKSN
jgi:hypothetical protein